MPLTKNEPHLHQVTRCSCGEHLHDCGCPPGPKLLTVLENECEMCRTLAGLEPFGDGGPTLDDIRGTG